MSEETDQQTEPVTPPPQEGEASETDLDTLPDWARKAISKANREAADYRTKLRDAEAELAPLKEAAESAAEAEKGELQKAQERVDQLASVNGALETQNARLAVRLELGLTADQAEFISGSNVEEMTASAKKLLATFAPQAVADDAAPSHQIVPKVRPAGLDPTVDPEERDPVKLAAKVHASYRLY